MRSERNDNNNISDYLNMCHKVLVGKEDFNDKKLWESPQNIGPLTPGGSEKHHSRHNMVCCLICNMERRQKRRAQPHPDEPCTSSRFIIKWKSSENPHFDDICILTKSVESASTLFNILKQRLCELDMCLNPGKTQAIHINKGLDVTDGLQ
ncbi:hypothetical protein M8J77_014375 [Diaphorina citri]|nr:hypothetical protein M8J77_014375 [Diaphorina citri]